MRLLLDTHILIWSALDPGRIPPAVASALIDPDHELWISPISLWETLLLAERGRIEVENPTAWVRELLSRLPVREAPLTAEVALGSRSIGLPHEDPADRFIAATALVYDLTLVTADRRLGALNEISVMTAR